MTNEKKERESNIELLRVILMILITLHHFSLYSGVKEISKITYHACEWGGKIGVVLFLIISGYYMVNSRFKIKKIMKLWTQIFFYSISLYIVFHIISKTNKLDSIDIIRYCIPINSNEYGFITRYFYVYILSPFVIKMIKSVKKEYFQKFLILSAFIFLIFNNFIIGSKIEYFENTFGYIFFFLIGCYIKLYNLKFFQKRYKINIIISVIIILIYIFVGFYLEKINIKNNLIFYDFITRVKSLGINSIFTLYCSVSIFFYFLNIKIRNKIINYIASCSLSVYLIQEQPKFRTILWKRIFNINVVNQDNIYEFTKLNTNIVNKICAIPCTAFSTITNLNTSKFFISYAVIATIIIFIFATVVDTIRKITLEKIFNKILNVEKVNEKCKEIDDWMNS